MVIIEIIAHFVFDYLFIDIFGGLLSRLNNYLLRLRGKETKSLEEIKLEKLGKRYVNKNVKLLQSNEQVEKGATGVVLKLINDMTVLVKMNDGEKTILELKLKDLLRTK